MLLPPKSPIPAPRGPPLRPSCRVISPGSKRPLSDPSDVNTTKKKKPDVDEGETEIYKENHVNFMNFLTKEMEITYRLKRAKG